MNSVTRRRIGFRVFVCMAIAFASGFSAGAAQAKTLRLVTDVYSISPTGQGNANAPGWSIEVVQHVFTALGWNVSFEYIPFGRAMMMIVRGERDGISGVFRTRDRERICLFPDEPLANESYVFFVRTADVEKLKFSSFDELIGHDIAVEKNFLPSSAEPPQVPPELSKFLRDHHSMVETDGNTESLRMLAAGRVDYAIVGLAWGKRDILGMGLTGKIEPLSSRSVIEKGIYVCFTRARISPAFVDTFSRALRQFKRTEAFQSINHKYLP